MTYNKLVPKHQRGAFRKNTRPITQRRKEARKDLKENFYVALIVDRIARTGETKATETLQHVRAELVRAHQFNPDIALPTTHEWVKYYEEAVELSVLFHAQPVVMRGLVNPVPQRVGRPIENMEGRTIGALVVGEPTGYVVPLSENNSPLWFCACQACCEEVVKSTHELNHALPYCGDTTCTEGRDIAKAYRAKGSIKSEPPKPRTKPEQASDAADHMITNISKDVH